MRRIIFLLAIAGISNLSFSQNLTDASLFMRSDSATYRSEISSETGDLYTKVGHHGPAVENSWLALRIYFDHKCAIDVYSKSRPGLELKEARWYPDAEMQKSGWGADYYKVGNSVGLGGVRLWDGKEVIKLNPVTQRTARVYSKKDHSTMEMVSEGVEYMGKKVDILVKVTVYSDTRIAKVEAKELNGEKVTFVTGINYWPGQKIEKQDGLIVTWGLHPEDVAAEQVELGAAFMYDPGDFEKLVDDGTQFLVISKPTKKIEARITSANSREPELNTMPAFLKFLQKNSE